LFTNRVLDVWNSLQAAIVLSHNVSTFECRLAESNLHRFLHDSWLLLLLYLFYCSLICVYFMTMPVVVFTFSSIKLSSVTSLNFYTKLTYDYRLSTVVPLNKNLDDATINILVMAALRSRCGHYIFALWFLLLSSSFFFFFYFPRLISTVADWMSTILLHMVCALVRI